MNFKIDVVKWDNYLQLLFSGSYTLDKAFHAFKFAVDQAIAYNYSRILMDAFGVKGIIPRMDRYHYAEFLANYIRQNALGKIHRISMTGPIPIVDHNRFGETVAVNRGVNARVFTNREEALSWVLADI